MAITNGGRRLMEVQFNENFLYFTQRSTLFAGRLRCVKDTFVNTRETTLTQRHIAISEDKHGMLKIHPKKIEKEAMKKKEQT